MTKTTCQDSSGLHCKPSSEELPIEFWQQKAEKYRREYTKVRKSLGEYFMKFIESDIENIKLKKQLELAIEGLKNCKTREHIGAICRTPEYVDSILQQISDIADYNKITEDPIIAIHKAVDKANKKLENRLENTVEALYKIATKDKDAATMVKTARKALDKTKD